jgi:YbbR-like protein.
LDEIIYRNIGGNSYSYSSQYIAEKIASRLAITPNDITINENTIFFEMDDFNSKVVPIRLEKDLELGRQYEIYGNPIIVPAAITIFGPADLLDTINYISTETLSKKNVTQNISEEVKLNLLDGSIRANINKVHVTIEIEKFTETEIAVPIQKVRDMNLRYFPENIKVRCLVAIKDFSDITPNSFKAEINKTQLSNLEPLLNVKLTHSPNNVHILKVEPEQVEYIILQQ